MSGFLESQLVAREEYAFQYRFYSLSVLEGKKSLIKNQSQNVFVITHYC